MKDFKPFWTITDKNAYILSPIDFKMFLQQSGFYKYYPSNSEGFMFIKKKGDFIDTVSVTEIKDYTLELLEGIGENNAWNMMASRINYFSKEYLAMINTANIEIAKDTKEEAFIYYKNKAVKVTKNEISLVEYKDVKGFVWRDQVIDRDIILKPESNGVYKSFIWKVAGEQVDRYYAFKSVIGYLLHSYKDKSKNRAIIFNDEMISNSANGGSGKGLFHKAIGHVKKISTIDGKSFVPDKSFVFQTVNPDSQVLLFDDVHKNFNFERLFSIITEQLVIEKKGLHPTVLPFEESPKITITTNYTIQGEGGSFRRRVFELELSTYFNDKYTPYDEFGKYLFDDWNKKEWEDFDNYMLRSLQFFLQKGLVDYNKINLSERKVIDATNPDFFAFMEDLKFEGERWYKTDLKDKFTLEYSDYLKANWFNSRKFNDWVRKYCDYKDYTLVEDKTNGMRWMAIMEQGSEIKEDNNEGGAPF